MIHTITAGNGLHISGNYYSAPYVNMSNPSAGMVRYNGSNLEVYDGTGWLTMPSSIPQIELDNEVQATLEWTRAKMAEELRIKELAAQHPAVADALAKLQEAQDQLAVVTALVNV